MVAFGPAVPEAQVHQSAERLAPNASYTLLRYQQVRLSSLPAQLVTFVLQWAHSANTDGVERLSGAGGAG